jgi:hypothetical protein
MGILSGGKPAVGNILKANDIKSVADGVRDAGIGATNNNNVQQAKGLSNALLNILGFLSPMPASKMASDVAQEGVNGAIDALANRKKQIDDAVDAATGGGTGGERGAAPVAVLGAPAVAAVPLGAQAALVVMQAQAEPRLPAATPWFSTSTAMASKPPAPARAPSSSSTTMPMA